MIRQTGAADWERYRDVRLRALAADPDAFLATHAQESQLSAEEWQRRATPGDDRASFVVEENGRFGGLVSCFVAGDPANVFLVAMWVAPDLRGTGAARELLAAVVAWARASGAVRVCLSVEGDNDRAVRLYARCGFVETDDPPAFPYVPNDGNRFFVFEL